MKNKKGRRRRAHRVMRLVALAFAMVVVLAAASLFAALAYLGKDLPSAEQITHRQVAQSTKIYDRTGQVLLYEIASEQKRTVVPFDKIPQYLKDATIAIEDENFYREPAFDWRGVVRSLIANIRHRSIVQGGSTITQQLARNAFLTPERTITRKLKELLLATKLNRHYTKDEILTIYLNEIPYGPMAYGVEAASETFFGKSVSDATLAESAVLAALPKAPTYYSPWGTHRSELISRSQLVLKKMLELHKITEAEYKNAMDEQVSFSAQQIGIKAPHFVMEIQDYLTQKYGDDVVRTGGLRVITTLDWDMQQIAEKAVADGAARNTERYGGTNAALVAQDPKTGQVLALVGSYDYFDPNYDGNFNVATQGLRQPGSSLKPFVYLTAFEKGYTPETVIFDALTEFSANNPDCPPVPLPEISEDATSTEPGRCFHPHNFDDKFMGPLPIRQALALSRNIPAVKVLYLAGMDDVFSNMNKFGITTLTNPNIYGLSLVLGGGAVKLIDLVEAYSVLAQEGVKHEQVFVLGVRDAAGNTLESYQDRSERVVDPQYPRLINDILSDVSARAGLFGGITDLTTLPDRDVAIKTGTSNDYRDAWTVGYTPSIVVGIWVGNNDNAPMHKYGSSIVTAMPIWHDFMSQVIATRPLPLETFTRPDPIPAAKPALAGEYIINRQIHSILHYIDRRNPTGPPPTNPTADPQFINWEIGVLSWVAQNMQTIPDYGRVLGATSTNTIADLVSAPRVTIQTPRNGSYIKPQSDVSIAATFSGMNPVTSLAIYWNEQPVQSFSFPNSSATSYELRWSFMPKDIKPQNMLEIEARDAKNATVRSQAILYQQ